MCLAGATPARLPFRERCLCRVQGLKRRPGAAYVFTHKFIARQFKKPKGLTGMLIGWVMAHRPSNRRRNAWTVDLLDIAPDDRVLEIGCGPGVAVAAIAARLTTGLVVGIDHSATMTDQASLRNHAAIHDGRARFRTCGLNDLPVMKGGFTKVAAINVLHFLNDLDAACAAIVAVMAPGGLLAVTYQPRIRNATHNDAAAFGDHLAVAFSHAGLVGIRMEELALKPTPAICVLGRKPDKPARKR
jgi:SAM-dependent methyltransferase